MITSADYLLPRPADGLGGYAMPAVFRAAVTRGGDGPAVYAGRWRTWREWSTEANALAAALSDRGVRRGDVVALQLPNSWEFLTLHVAAALLGAVTLPVHLAFGPAELSALLDRTSATVLATPATFRGHDRLTAARAARDTQPNLRVLLVTERTGGRLRPGEFDVAGLAADHAGAPVPDVAVPPDEPLALLASSGTTSLRPKICLHTHDGLLTNAATVAREGAGRADDTLISASPYTHAFGLLAVHLSLFTGGRLAVLPGWNVGAFLDLTAASGASVLFAVPAQLRDLTATLAAEPERDVALREVRTGGAAVPADLVAAVRKRVGARVIVQWGMSELGAGTYTRPDDPDEAASRSIGRPAGTAEVRVAAPPGEVGDLLYRGPYGFRGYLNEPELTAAAVDADGWLRTGDLARLNDDGTVAYAGRDSEQINRGGLKFSAVEVEGLLADLDQIAQLAVVGRPDERLGQRAALVVALRPGGSLDLATVTAHLAGKGLATYKWPEDLIVLDSLPSTPTGKIARRLLDDRLGP